jgi:hypothetical protein
VVLRDGREQKLRVKFQAAETKPGH